MKSPFSSILTSAPKIRRRHLRKFSWLPDVLRIKGSIVPRLIGPVLTVTIWAALVCYLALIKGQKVLLTNTVLPLLSVVVGLILVFRNGTSYDRYWEGRKSFAAMTSNIRNITRMIWVSVCPPPSDGQPPLHAKGKTPTSELTAAQLRRRKIEAIKLAVSFAFATKHYLREEDGIYFEDYADVLPASFARFDETGYNTQRTTTPTSYAATRDNSKTPSADGNRGRSGRASPAPDKTPDATKRVRPKRRKPNTSFAGLNSPLLGDTHRTVEFHPFADHLTLPLPLVIAHELARLIFSFRRDGFLETIGPAGANSMSSLVHGMVDQLTAMERVANTPIPASYGIHLKQCVTLYLFALPFTLIYDLGWATIPVVTVVAFTFMGIEGIADEIEMPFGHDRSDLPLDRYCHDLKEEVEYIIARLPESGEGSWGYDDGEGDD